MHHSVINTRKIIPESELTEKFAEFTEKKTAMCDFHRSLKYCSSFDSCLEHIIIQEDSLEHKRKFIITLSFVHYHIEFSNEKSRMREVCE